jgi:ceramide glucosyltransferase
VGLVSSLVVGTGERSWGAALENLQLAGYVAPAVVASVRIGRRPLTVGKSMAFRRADLARVGGFAAVSDVLAEDHVLGRLFRDAGFDVRIVLVPVENRNVACSIMRTLERHTRWAKMRRAIVPGPFFFEPLGNPMVIALATFLVVPSSLALLLVVACALLQIAGAELACRLLRGARPHPWRVVLLEPLRAFVIQLCWLRAVVSRRIEWRGHPFLLGEDSTLQPLVDGQSGPSSRRFYLRA